MKKQITLLIISLIAIVMISGCVEDTSVTAQDNDNTIKVVEMEQGIQIENLKYTANHWELFDDIGSYSLDYIEASGIFIVIDISIENSGKDTETISSSNFKLIDSQERTYEPHSKGSFYLTYMDYDPIIFEKLGPSLTKTGNIVFDISEDSTGLKLMIENNGYVNIGNVLE